MADVRDNSAPRPRNNRSKVSNGTKLFIEPIDSQSRTGRRFKDQIFDIMADLGGRDMLSENQKKLIRRSALISTLCERIEAEAVQERPINVNDYVVLVNCERRLCEALGLKRVARPVNDGSEALTDYFAKPKPPE
jgi:hypothetical protein